MNMMKMKKSIFPHPNSTQKYKLTDAAYHRHLVKHEEVLSRSQNRIVERQNSKVLKVFSDYVQVLQEMVQKYERLRIQEQIEIRKILFDMDLMRKGKRSCLLPSISMGSEKKLENCCYLLHFENKKSIRRERIPNLPVKHRFILGKRRSDSERKWNR